MGFFISYFIGCKDFFFLTMFFPKFFTIFSYIKYTISMNTGTYLGKLIDFSRVQCKWNQTWFENKLGCYFLEDWKIESFINPKDHSQNHTRVSTKKNPETFF
jgi:hypothetical protein